MGPKNQVKPEELPPPTTIEELWTRMNARFETLERRIDDEGDPWLHNTVVYLKQMYANYRKTD